MIYLVRRYNFNALKVLFASTSKNTAIGKCNIFFQRESEELKHRQPEDQPFKDETYAYDVIGIHLEEEIDYMDINYVYKIKPMIVKSEVI